MSELLCITCKGPKAKYECGLCQEHSCKKCVQVVSDNFTYLKKVLEHLTHTHYCSFCFDAQVSEAFNEYNETVEKAKEIIIYTKDQSKLTRFLKRKEDPIIVENCEDEEEALMRMSFFAAQMKFNCLIDVEFKTKKMVVGSHKKTIYAASAIPITIDPNTIRGHEDPP